ncbi:MAG: Asp23/Gls24 family envelope stress response protein [Clostridia bacterium]|nr:Asp23/Gls24 family envelope stress response protein [Clostridia bacterium]
MDENKVYTDGSAVKISDEVVQTIAAMAVSEVKGVSLATSLADGFVEKFVKKNYNKTVKIEMTEKEVSLELHVTVDYGVKIQAVSAELQEAVKRNLENMTDLTATNVTIYVEGVNPVKEAEKASAPSDAE